MFVPFRQDCYDSAMQEQAARAPYMQTKFEDNEKRRAGQLRGLVIEHHVRQWLEQRLGSRLLPADNAGIWTQVCNHDFKVACSFGKLLVDVSGPKADGTYGTYSGKRSCHFHILARPMHMPSWQAVDFSKGFWIDGVVNQANYLEKIDGQSVLPFENWLAELEI